VKKIKHRHRIAFESQFTLPFGKNYEGLPKYSEKPSEPDRYPSLCATLYTAGGVGELYQRRSTIFVIVTLLRPKIQQDWGRARTAANRFARDDKELGPQLGEAITRKTAS
jgi:hypothetical protein